MPRPFDQIIGLDIESTWGRAIGLGFSCQTQEEYTRDPRFKLWGLSWAVLDAQTGEHHETWVRANGLRLVSMRAEPVTLNDVFRTLAGGAGFQADRNAEAPTRRARPQRRGGSL